jgi:hypothetical protein
MSVIILCNDVHFSLLIIYYILHANYIVYLDVYLLLLKFDLKKERLFWVSYLSSLNFSFITY